MCLYFIGSGRRGVSAPRPRARTIARMLAIAIVALLPCAALPSATIQDSARIATFDDVYQKQPPAPKPAPKAAPTPRAQAVGNVVAPHPPPPAAVPEAPSPGPEVPQLIRHVPPPVVTLESSPVPVPRAIQPPLVSLPPAGN